LNGCGGGVNGSHETRQRKEWPTLHKNHEGLGHPRNKDKVKIIPHVKGGPPALHKNHEGLGHPRNKDKVKIIPHVKGGPPALRKNHEGLGHPRNKDKVKIISRVKGAPPATPEIKIKSKSPPALRVLHPPTPNRPSGLSLRHPPFYAPPTRIPTIQVAAIREPAAIACNLAAPFKATPSVAATIATRMFTIAQRSRFKRAPTWTPIFAAMAIPMKVTQFDEVSRTEVRLRTVRHPGNLLRMVLVHPRKAKIVREGVARQIKRKRIRRKTSNRRVFIYDLVYRVFVYLCRMALIVLKRLT
jgi:hypothetical protein